jgi:hypothetical protein
MGTLAFTPIVIISSKIVRALIGECFAAPTMPAYR